MDGWAGDEIVVESARPAAVQADGEPLGWHTRVRIAPGPSLRVLIPPAAATEPTARTRHRHGLRRSRL
jgi:hypothetical protein